MSTFARILLGITAALVALAWHRSGRAAVAPPDVRGNWRIVDSVEYGPAAGERFTFVLTLGQNENQIVGIAAPLSLLGEVDGQTLTASYQQPSGVKGNFTWSIDPIIRVLRGTFTSSLGNGGSSVGLPEFETGGLARATEPTVLVGAVVGLVPEGGAFLVADLPVVLLYVDDITGAVTAVGASVTRRNGFFSFRVWPGTGAYYVSLAGAATGDGPCEDGPLMPLLVHQNAVILRCFG